MIRRLLALMLGTTMAWAASAAEFEGIGVFETLNKPWFLTALYADYDSAPGERQLRMEIKVLEDKITARKFRQLWLEVMAVGQSQAALKSLQRDFDAFASVIKGTLRTGDHLVLEQRGDHVAVSLNYSDHAQLSAEFLPTLVKTLTARIAPIPELKRGLTGKLAAREKRELLNQFDSTEPSLRRIAQTSRWLRQSDVQISTL